MLWYRPRSKVSDLKNGPLPPKGNEYSTKPDSGTYTAGLGLSSKRSVKEDFRYLSFSDHATCHSLFYLNRRTVCEIV